MNHQLTPEQQLQVSSEKSRRLHDRLAELDASLRELEANPTRYTVAAYDLRFQAIARLRQQTLKEIQAMQA